MGLSSSSLESYALKLSENVENSSTVKRMMKKAVSEGINEFQICWVVGRAQKLSSIRKSQKFWIMIERDFLQFLKV